MHCSKLEQFDMKLTTRAGYLNKVYLLFNKTKPSAIFNLVESFIWTFLLVNSVPDGWELIVEGHSLNQINLCIEVTEAYSMRKMAV